MADFHRSPYLDIGADPFGSREASQAEKRHREAEQRRAVHMILRRGRDLSPAGRYQVLDHLGLVDVAQAMQAAGELPGGTVQGRVMVACNCDAGELHAATCATVLAGRPYAELGHTPWWLYGLPGGMRRASCCKCFGIGEDLNQPCPVRAQLAEQPTFEESKAADDGE